MSPTTAANTSPKKQSSLLPLVLLIGIVVLLGIVYFMVPRSTTIGTTTLTAPSPQAKSGQVVVKLTQLNNSGESGTAVLEEKDGYVIVTLNVAGGKSGIAQPAHLHTNSCPGLGAIKYPLKNVVNGTSVTTLNLTLAQLKKELPLAVNVHESTDNIKNYVACGEISL